MAILLKVEWVEQADGADFRRRVVFIGGKWVGSNWRHTAENAVQYIEAKAFAYYIQTNGHPMNLIVVTQPDGSQGLGTREDAGLGQHLLALPEPPLVAA